MEKKSVNYMQWETQEDYEAFVNNAGIQGQFQAQHVQVFGEIDTHLYENRCFSIKNWNASNSNR
jgi:hypothetical protein